MEPKAQLYCADDARVACPLFQAEYGGSKPTSALQLRIEECGMRRAQALNRMWHSVLPETHLGNLVGKPKKIAYVAEHTGTAYAVAIWTSPIAANRLTDGWNALELRRLAISNEAPPNTASRMLSIMARLIRRKWPSINRLISYQAERHHKGVIYAASGWKAVNRSESAAWHPKEQNDIRQTRSAVIRWEFPLCER